MRLSCGGVPPHTPLENLATGVLLMLHYAGAGTGVVWLVKDGGG